MCKICTDIGQSKKLIELGLDITTADMYYRSLNLNGHISWTYHIKRLEPPIYDYEHYVPSWSLSTLLNFIWNNGCTATGIPKLYRDRPANGWYILIEGLYETPTCNTILDAAFEMVSLLLKNKKL